MPLNGLVLITDIDGHCAPMRHSPSCLNRRVVECLIQYKINCSFKLEPGWMIVNWSRSVRVCQIRSGCSVGLACICLANECVPSCLYLYVALKVAKVMPVQQSSIRETCMSHRALCEFIAAVTPSWIIRLGSRPQIKSIVVERLSYVDNTASCSTVTAVVICIYETVDGDMGCDPS
jgi:hypothetical protein